LLRLAAIEDGQARAQAVADPLARMPGRGAYLCRTAGSPLPVPDCLAQATRRGGIARALRRSIPGGLVLDSSELVESVSR
jgi:predicted RNA-binding protein YlxR (DUF448 family)